MSALDAILPVYRRSDVLIVRGDGAYLYDDSGKAYLDFAAGIAVNALGHNHPATQAALLGQASQLWHCANMYRNAPLEALAEHIVAASGFAKGVFFCSSGAEANEAAIKFIRRIMKLRGTPERYRIITIKGGFHGRTMACISASGELRAVDGYAPLLDGFDHAPFGDFEALEALVNGHTAGVMLEPVQGEGGVHVHSVEYLRALRALCDKHGLLLLLDEVQCGMGRTGTLFTYQESGIAPDLVTVAKGLGNGFPVGACLANAEVAKYLTPGCHGSTFGGNPMAMAVGLAVLKEIEKAGFLENVKRCGEEFLVGLEALVKKFPQHLKAARGKGLMLGLETHISAYSLMDTMRGNGLMSAAAGDKVVRLLPPLIITSEHIKEALMVIDKTLENWNI